MTRTVTGNFKPPMLLYRRSKRIWWRIYIPTQLAYCKSCALVNNDIQYHTVFNWILFWRNDVLPDMCVCVWVCVCVCVWVGGWVGGGGGGGSLQWHHNERDGVSNQLPYIYLLNGLFRPALKKTPKLCVNGLCEVTGEFPAQRASNAEYVSIQWRHHDILTGKIHGFADPSKHTQTGLYQTFCPGSQSWNNILFAYSL